MTQILCYETSGRPVFITVVLHRRIPHLKNLVGQVAPQALPDAYETTLKNSFATKALRHEGLICVLILEPWCLCGKKILRLIRDRDYYKVLGTLNYNILFLCKL